MGAEATFSEISRNSQKFEKQFSLISSYFSELNTSVPASFMDNELLIIELLSTKQKIMMIIKKQTRKMSVTLGFYFIGALFFFYGLAGVVYQYLLNRGGSCSSIDRVTNLYGFFKACVFLSW